MHSFICAEQGQGHRRARGRRAREKIGKRRNSAVLVGGEDPLATETGQPSHPAQPPSPAPAQPPAQPPAEHQLDPTQPPAEHQHPRTSDHLDTPITR